MTTRVVCKTDMGTWEFIINHTYSDCGISELCFLKSPLKASSLPSNAPELLEESIQVYNYIKRGVYFTARDYVIARKGIVYLSDQVRMTRHPGNNINVYDFMKILWPVLTKDPKFKGTKVGPVPNPNSSNNIIMWTLPVDGANFR